ncbi:MAG: ABC transporter ATP-binding protein [Paracoccaceae bacterium]
MTLLSARNVTRRFGGLVAVDGVDFDLAKGEIRALIGPNGAGKTTFVSMLAGRISASSGAITFGGRDVTRLPAHRRIRAGMAYTFQITSVFTNLTVEENVTLAVQRQAARGETSERVRAALAQVGLQERTDQRVGDLAYGHQRLLEIAMGIGQSPRLLILDEPTQGLTDGEVQDFIKLVRELARVTTILLIEHNIDVVMALATRITVMNFGRVIAEGPPDAIRANADVQAAYLGG